MIRREVKLFDDTCLTFPLIMYELFEKYSFLKNASFSIEKIYSRKLSSVTSFLELSGQILSKKMKFSVKDFFSKPSKCEQKKTADLFKFVQEILKGTVK